MGNNKLIGLNLAFNSYFSDSALIGISVILTPYWTYRKTEQLFSKSDWSNNDTQVKTKKN